MCQPGRMIPATLMPSPATTIAIATGLVEIVGTRRDSGCPGFYFLEKVTFPVVPAFSATA